SLAGPLSFLGPKQAPAAKQSSNQSIAEDIASALRQAQVTGSDVDISFTRGVATLSGTVSDETQKRKATYAASRVPGVERVDNRLALVATPAGPDGNPFAAGAVAPADYETTGRESGEIQQVLHAPAPAPEALQARSNQEMAERIARELSKARLSGFDIEIKFRGGTVILLGSVGDAAQRKRAEEAARNVPGVKAVENRLLVGTPETPGSRDPRGFDPRHPVMPAAWQGQPPMPMPPGGLAPNGAPMPPIDPSMGPPPGPYAAAGAMPLPTPYTAPAPGGAHTVYNMPYVPEYAWPATAEYPNSAAVSYPTQYSASAWPYIGPFYPYPQVPLGWRDVRLEWDDGHWMLDFNSRTDRWWWFLHPKNW
ncbi:MAG: BON domain-containing protein, partial [Planctomycetes bacterium]|nr:BON domain-containing protein [Planctomycetota bacterium]